MNQQDTNIYNVPAFQRRRSIEARARKVDQGVNKRVVIPQGRVEPFPQVIDKRRSVSTQPSSSFRESSYRPMDAYKHRPVSTPGVRNIASEALDNVMPGSVPKTLFQRIKGRMGREDEYDDGYIEDEYVEEEPQALRRMECVGIATMYFEKIQVSVVDLIADVSIGDRLIFEGENNSLFEQVIESMQVNKSDIRHARKGQEIGTKVILIPKLGGKVWKVVKNF